MKNQFIAIGSICGFLAVALGAFGAHALKGMLAPDMLEVYQTGVHYHMIHALALVAIGLASSVLPRSSGHLRRAGWSMLIGILLFSGSLYVLSVTGIKVLGAITPLGGLAFLFGWLSLALAARK
ncbi:DUF423 domain-containing protein [Paenibacillus cremeus]|uniref:DUF423 domain-containing protein n=1 Tax=Paenibacillus cremeus TaxID=2163881 RepID=A0A559KE45_9BACL|nr:DUF423 domain-containing protein [Paenibacillus cremeus]TVY10405.1 DUF423 domain-containing protein [Paenibacillus cremeus]